ncbi:single-stranded DNA-binding protein [Deinococcus aluminii]|uniref:Single-stranded DNA-binding protein n=1 Tax=Deinococcus aluminii TaxID=1656885 RepID=A0ABP9XEX4_9DEIO
MLNLTTGTHVEFTAALCRSAALKPGGQFATFTLAGEFERPRGEGEPVRTVFYQRAVASGRLAARLGTLGAGEAVTGTGVLATLDGELVVAVQEAARLPHDPVRLELDGRGGARLLLARFRVGARGVLISEPSSERLENGVPVANARLGLTPRREGEGAPGQLVPVELAAYGDFAELLREQAKGSYLKVWGLLQHRQGTQQRFTRLEMLDAEVLHETRALV